MLSRTVSKVRRIGSSEDVKQIGTVAEDVAKVETKSVVVPLSNGSDFTVYSSFPGHVASAYFNPLRKTVNVDCSNEDGGGYVMSTLNVVDILTRHGFKVECVKADVAKSIRASLAAAKHGINVGNRSDSLSSLDEEPGLVQMIAAVSGELEALCSRAPCLYAKLASEDESSEYKLTCSPSPPTSKARSTALEVALKVVSIDTGKATGVCTLHCGEIARSLWDVGGGGVVGITFEEVVSNLLEDNQTVTGDNYYITLSKGNGLGKLYIRLPSDSFTETLSEPKSDHAHILNFKLT
jgi:hypothetical protein